jgi:hypothetical protein
MFISELGPARFRPPIVSTPDFLASCILHHTDRSLAASPQMADLLKHLEFLVGSSEDSSSVDSAERGVWQRFVVDICNRRFPTNIRNSFQNAAEDSLPSVLDQMDLHPDPWNSVVDIYRVSESSTAQIYRSLVTKLSSCVHFRSSCTFPLTFVQTTRCRTVVGVSAGCTVLFSH